MRREFDFPNIGSTTRILEVPSASVAHVEATLRAQPGVRSVGVTGGRRYPLAVTAPYYTNDPYFAGFLNPATTGGVTPLSTYHVPPYDESANVPGQWGMHAARFDSAFAYSQSGNGSNVSSANALGSPSVKIAIIDSGADTSHPELAAPKIAYQRCFITAPDSSQSLSTSNFVTDTDGHGTSVSGIAAAITNNALGFTGAGGNSTLYEYRIDPTPDSNCSDPTKSQNDPQCGGNVVDVISAINDAVAQGVNVISLSLGSFGSDGTSSGCQTNGVDGSSAEGTAIANALAKNIVVVAASGNGGGAALTAPACDQGVIAAGASALADGQPNGAKNSNGSAVHPLEYVASYSSYGTPGVAYRNAAAWGIVAPGGDPVANDPDQLHWIQNIYTSTPFDGVTSCSPDYPFTAGSPTECQILIAGTSMSAPLIAGAAALIIAVNPTYQSPTRMKQLLCATTDDISDAREGCGRLNIYRAMAVALGDTVTP